MRKNFNIADDYCELVAKKCYSLKPGFRASAAGEIRTINPIHTQTDTAEQTLLNKYIENTMFMDCKIPTPDGDKYFCISAYVDNLQSDWFVFSNSQMTRDPPPPFYLIGKLYFLDTFNDANFLSVSG